MRRRTGFTLIELLVVIAIIALLAAILFPIYLTAKAKGQQAQCLGNMKQIGLATMLYVDDHNSTYPMACWTQAEYQSPYGYFYNLRPYLRTSRVLRCPVHPSKSRVTYGVNGAASVSTYGFDAIWGLWAWWNGSFYGYPAKQSQVRTATKCIMVFDPARDEPGGVVNWGWFGCWFGESWYGAKYRPNHMNGANFVFCDGHASYISLVDHPGWNQDREWSARWTDMITWPAKRISFDRDYVP